MQMLKQLISQPFDTEFKVSKNFLSLTMKLVFLSLAVTEACSQCPTFFIQMKGWFRFDGGPHCYTKFQVQPAKKFC